MSIKKDWSKINRSLINRGSIQIWFPENIIDLWYSKVAKHAPGRPNLYSDLSIQLALIIQCWLNKPLRQTCGFMRDLFGQDLLCLSTPDYTTLSRRKSAINPLKGLLAGQLGSKKQFGPIDLLLDSTGIKLHGPGHWLSQKKGSGKCKWFKLHLAVNAKTQQIEAWITTPANVADCKAAIPLLEKVYGTINSVVADGAYDSSKLRKTLHSRGIDLCAPPQLNARLQNELPKSQQNEPRVGPHMEGRDSAIERIRETGSKKAWMEESGYHIRSLVETAMGRFKGAFGTRVTSSKPQNIATEIAIKIGLLNMWMHQNQQVKSV